MIFFLVLILHFMMGFLVLQVCIVLECLCVCVCFPAFCLYWFLYTGFCPTWWLLETTYLNDFSTNQVDLIQYNLGNNQSILFQFSSFLKISLCIYYTCNHRYVNPFGWVPKSFEHLPTHSRILYLISTWCQSVLIPHYYISSFLCLGLLTVPVPNPLFLGLCPSVTFCFRSVCDSN